MLTTNTLHKINRYKLAVAVFRSVYYRNPKHTELSYLIESLDAGVSLSQIRQELRSKNTDNSELSDQKKTGFSVNYDEESVPNISILSGYSDFFQYCVFDITDLINYLISGNNSVTGIQRLLTATLNELSLEERNSCILFSTIVQPGIIEPKIIDWKVIDVIIKYISGEIEINLQEEIINILKESIPLDHQMGVMIMKRMKYLFIMGAGWIIPGFPILHKEIARTYNLKIVSILYDLIPFSRPEYVSTMAAREFFTYLTALLNISDKIITISKYVAKDLMDNKYFLEKFCPVFPLVNAVQLPQELPLQNKEYFTSTPPLGGLIPDNAINNNFILNVGSIEIRKNHISLFLAWRHLIGLLGNDCPTLVIVGKIGWKCESFLEELRSTNNLDGKIVVLNHVDDKILSNLYLNCLFTVYPSLEEGWGLPIGESLAAGKFCITSNTTSMPEVGGDLCDYIDPRNPIEIATKIADIVKSMDILREKENKIRSSTLKNWMQYKVELASEFNFLVSGDNGKSRKFNNSILTVGRPVLFYSHLCNEVYDRKSGLGNEKITLQQITQARLMCCSGISPHFEQDGNWILGNFLAEFYILITDNLQLNSNFVLLVHFDLPPGIDNLKETGLELGLDYSKITKSVPITNPTEFIEQLPVIKHINYDCFSINFNLKDVDYINENRNHYKSDAYVPIRISFKWSDEYRQFIKEKYENLGLIKLKEMILNIAESI